MPTAVRMRAHRWGQPVIAVLIAALIASLGAGGCLLSLSFDDLTKDGPLAPDAGDTSIEDAEDDPHSAIVALNALKLNSRDVVIGVAASGMTAFVVAGVRHAREKGVWTCGIANNRGAPLLQEADHAVLLDTGPEVLTGSTRLKAGTAQKLALNRISTAAMVLSGKVVENLMVDVKANNRKLKERCARIVCELTTATFDEACTMLERHDWNIREVVVQLNRSPSVAGQPAT